MTATRILLFRSFEPLSHASNSLAPLPIWLRSLGRTPGMFTCCSLTARRGSATSPKNARTASAADGPAIRLGLRQHKDIHWTVDDGVLRRMWRMAQTPDGFLWFAANGGLSRFGGVTCERVPPPGPAGLAHGRNGRKVLSVPIPRHIQFRCHLKGGRPKGALRYATLRRRREAGTPSIRGSHCSREQRWQAEPHWCQLVFRDSPDLV